MRNNKPMPTTADGPWQVSSDIWILFRMVSQTRSIQDEAASVTEEAFVFAAWQTSRTAISRYVSQLGARFVPGQLNASQILGTLGKI